MSRFKVGDKVRILASEDHAWSDRTGTVIEVTDSSRWPIEVKVDGHKDFFVPFARDELERLLPLDLWLDDVAAQETVPERFEVRVTNPETGGQKGTKPAQFSLLPWDVLSDLAEHYAKGAAKYDRHNWRKGYNWSLSIDALGRHLAAFIEGETYDPETGSHHMLAVMFHAAALVYFTKAHPSLDDRRQTVQARESIQKAANEFETPCGFLTSTFDGYLINGADGNVAN